MKYPYMGLPIQPTALLDVDVVDRPLIPLRIVGQRDAAVVWDQVPTTLYCRPR